MENGIQKGVWFYWGVNGALASVFDFGTGRGKQRGFYWDWEKKVEGQPPLLRIEDYEDGELTRTFRVYEGKLIEVEPEDENNS